MFAGLRTRLALPCLAPRGFATSRVAELLKSHSGTKKRFRLTASGAGQAGKQHLNTSFSASRINRLSNTAYTNKAQTRTVRRLLPYAR